MGKITNKIKNNKKRLLIISLILIILIIIILLYSLNTFKTTPKKQAKTSNSKYAYYIPDGSGGYTRTNTRPNRDLDYIKCNGEKLKKSKYTYNSSTGAFSVLGTSESTKCNLYFIPTFAELLKINNPPTTYTTVPGRAISTTDEGLIEGPNDDYGAKTYYFRGTAPDNYVTFAGLTWRVVRINGDGSVRLILNTNAQSGGSDITSAWNTNYDTGDGLASENATAVSYATYGNSTVKGAAESWYNENVGNNTNYSSKVVPSKFCNDRELPAGAAIQFFQPYTRLWTNQSPSMTCSTSSYVYNLNVGLLTADEVTFAGAYKETTNQSYYLYNSSLGSTYWLTLSPYYWNSGGGVSAFSVYAKYGNLNGYSLYHPHGLRLVISLSSEVSVTTASATNPGTSSNPYIVQ